MINGQCLKAAPLSSEVTVKGECQGAAAEQLNEKKIQVKNKEVSMLNKNLEQIHSFCLEFFQASSVN